MEENHDDQIKSIKTDQYQINKSKSITSKYNTNKWIKVKLNKTELLFIKTKFV